MNPVANKKKTHSHILHIPNACLFPFNMLVTDISTF